MGEPTAFSMKTPLISERRSAFTRLTDLALLLVLFAAGTVALIWLELAVVSPEALGDIAASVSLGFP